MTHTQREDAEREDFERWACTVRHSIDTATYNFARDAWLERARRELAAAAKATGMATAAADRNGEELLPEHML